MRLAAARRIGHAASERLFRYLSRALQVAEHEPQRERHPQPSHGHLFPVPRAQQHEHAIQVLSRLPVPHSRARNSARSTDWIGAQARARRDPVRPAASRAATARASNSGSPPRWPIRASPRQRHARETASRAPADLPDPGARRLTRSPRPDDWRTAAPSPAQFVGG